MKLSKNLISKILVTTTIASACAAAIGGTFSAVMGAYTILEDTYYTVTDNGHRFKCYLIDGEANSVAIGWLTGDDNPVPNDLTVPETVTIDGGSFTVKAVVKGGFRYCDFNTITLPKTITEIREEAFAYCENLESFTFPHGMTEIAPSTFLDCRNLTTLFYTAINEGQQVRVLGNSTIKSIGDHAFDSCINLSNFYCPSSVTYFGESCFQNCRSIAAFYFPSDNMLEGENRNLITVESYAFSDCPNLETVYFEENMYQIRPYAFANDHSNLRFTYTGQVEPTYDDHWRDVNLTTSNNNVYPFLEMGQSKIVQSTDYPGIIYSVETDDVYLDSCVGGGKTTTVKVIENSTQYIKINSFATPFATQEGYYDVSTGTLTIPNEINGKKVKVINASAFVNHTELQHIVFNQDLVQIQHWAFNGCTNITSLNFAACQQLKEISFEVFQKIGNTTMWQNEPPAGNQVYNTLLKNITLPNCLEYIGDAAFYNFPNLEVISFKTDANSSASLKMIGDYAFAVYRNNNSFQNHTNLVSIELPNTLNDSYASSANYYHPYQPWLNGQSNGACKTRIERTAIGRYVFDNADYLGTVTMEKTTATQDADANHKTSFASNVFVRCNNLVRFESNKKLYLIGADSFKGVSSLREIFLHTELSDDANSSYQFPWGISDANNNFQANPLSGVSEAVIYLSGSKAPKKLGDPDQYSTTGYMWNSEQYATNPNELQNNGKDGEANNRSHIPTFYNIHWDSGSSGDEVKYWQPGTTNSPTNTYLNGRPNSPADYKSGLVAIVKGSNAKYTVAKYFTDGNSARTNNTIDLAQLDIASSIDTIGEYAFAANNSNRGYYFVLPNSVTKIGDRAFYRQSGNAVRIVTYSNSNSANAVVPNSTTYPSATYPTFASIVTKANGTGNPGYCYLPSSVTKIERDAFYNNTFTSINLGGGLTFLGSSAFLTYQWVGKVADLTFTPDQGSDFAHANGGIYYVGNANQKALLYQPSGIDSTFTVADGTKAIGFRAVTNTKYTGVTLPTGLTTIYGGGFQKNTSLTTVDGAGLSTLKYISARSTEEVFNSTARTLLELYDPTYNTLPFDYYDNSDFSGSNRTEVLNKIYNRAMNSAFKGCSALATIDFTSMTSLKRIGPEAFNNCTSLSNMANSAAYNFLKIDSDGTISNVDTNKTTGVLDLSNCTQLRVMDKSCFNNCSTINYAILPNTTGDSHRTESEFYFGKNPDTDFNTGTAKVFADGTRVLFGETFYQVAYQRNVGFTTNHYPKEALNTGGFNSDFSKLKYFYRYHYAHSDETEEIGGVTYSKNVTYYANVGGGSDTMMGYWDYYNGNYYLFVGPSGAQAYYDFREAQNI